MCVGDAAEADEAKEKRFTSGVTGGVVMSRMTDLRIAQSNHLLRSQQRADGERERAERIKLAKDALAASDPAHVARFLEFVAHRDHYAETAEFLEKVVHPHAHNGRRRIIETLQDDLPEWVKALRLTCDLHVIPSRKYGNDRAENQFSIADLINFSKRNRVGFAVLACLGYARSPVGIVRLEDAEPAWWPDDHRERAGLLLNLLVRRMHGEYVPFRLVRR
jgi:hypothetical protein